MVSRLQAPDKTAELQEVWVAEFGVLNSKQLDPTVQHEGALYLWSQEGIEALCEVIGFNARIYMPTIRSLFLDVYKAEGHILVEYDRNTKPSDISIRYSRERWIVQELTGRGAAGLRQWIKTEYHARHLEPRVLAAIAEQLQVPPDNLSNFFIRFNFREKTVGVIAEERYAETMPTGALSWFTLPAKAMTALAADEATNNDSFDYPDSGDDTAAGGTYYQQQSHYAGANMMTQQPEHITEPAAETDAMQPPAAPETAAPVQSSAPIEPVAPTAQVEHAPVAADHAPVAAGGRPLTEAPKDAVATFEAPTATASLTITTAEQPAAPPPPPLTPMALAAAQAHGPRKATKNEMPLSELQKNAPVALATKPRHTTPERTYAPRTDFSQGEVKYATYSKSEVDYMMKQQADSILNALSGKVAAQQRAFQEAIVLQEKAFNKLTDNFIAQFEAARVKLEHTAKNSHDATKVELENFHKELSKELDEYRKQVSKTVAKVSEGGKAAAQQKQAEAKPQNVPPKAQQQLTAGQAKLQNLIMVTLLVSVASVVLSVISVISHAH